METETDEALECLDQSEECEGEVELLSLDPGVTRAFPRCAVHRERRIASHEENQRKYGGDCPPADFDPTYAGERWDED